jgi:hypothetical protein
MKQKLFWGLVLFLLLLAVGHFSYSQLLFRAGVALEGETAYWPFLLNHWWGRVAHWRLLVPLAGLLTAVYLFKQQRKALALGVVGAAVALVVIMSFSFVAAGYQGYRHLDSAQLGDRVYHLGRWSDWDNSGYYTLCECDRRSVACACHNFYQIQGIRPLADHRLSKTYLLADEADQTVLANRYDYRQRLDEFTLNYATRQIHYTLYSYQPDGQAACFDTRPNATLIGSCLAP